MTAECAPEHASMEMERSIHGGAEYARYAVATQSLRSNPSFEWIAGVCCEVTADAGAVHLRSAVRVANKMCVDKTIESISDTREQAVRTFEMAVREWRNDKSGAYPRLGL